MSDPTTEPELPRGIALAWGVAANPQRGPKRELSIERIVDAAIELADDGGLAAVSMSSVAAGLGYTPMSLYRYVTAKDDLILLMGERAIGLPSESLRELDGWRARLRGWAREQVEVYRRHPWILDVPMLGSMYTPSNVAWLDAALESLAPTPFTEEQKVAVSLALLAQTRFQGLVERSYDETAREAETSPDSIDAARVTVMEALVTAEEFPHVRVALDAGAFGPDDDSDPFAFGVERLLDGIERMIEAGGGVTDPSPEPLPHEVQADKHVKEAAKKRREAEKALRDARKLERQAIRTAREKHERS